MYTIAKISKESVDSMIIGREEEIAKLNSAANSGKAEFVAVYGRRRIGKTFLIRQTFGRFSFEHTGIRKRGTAKQLEEFAKSLAAQGYPRCKRPVDWYEAFDFLKELLVGKGEGRKIVFLDECPWMDTPKSDFVGALDHFWNGWASARSDIMLIICGSATSWVIEKIVDDYGGLHNRLTRQIYLRPFTLSECEALVRANGHVMNRDQILEGYMIMGGVPYYWDLLRKDIGFAQNIDALFFAAHGELSEEFDHLFLSLFRKPKLYISIIRALGTRKCGMTRNEIIAAIGATGNGMLTRALKELAQCDFIRVYAEPGRRKRDLISQLIDNYVLFYFRFIDGQTNLMPNFWSVSQTTQAVRVWCGLAFERVALQHVAAIKRKLGISGVVTRTYGWRFQGDGETNAGAQIDLVIDRDDKVVNLCEMKYTAGPFSITDEYDRRLKVKREVYAEQTGTKSAIHLTMVSAHGLKANANAFDVQSVITLDDLFRE